MASRQRLFYDPANPRMLSIEEIQRLTPSDIQAASDQIDQNMVILLQRIEEDFARCNQVVIERILPAVAQHGENSQRIYESVKFWKPFFEAAAAQRYVDQDNETLEGETVRSDGHMSAQDADGSLSFEHDASRVSQQSGEDDGGTPRASVQANKGAPGWSEDASLFDSLQADLGKLKLPSQAQPDQHHRLRLGDLPPDSPDIPVPEWETLNHTKGRAFPDPSPAHSSADSSLPLPFPSSSRIPSSNPALLHKILTKTFASSPQKAPASSTPGRPARSDLPRDWNGLADLSQTPLSAFASPIKRQGGADESGWTRGLAGGLLSATASRQLSSSPAPTSRAPTSTGGPSVLRSRAFESPVPARTPAKEAAHRMTMDVYNALEDSPLEPPSVMKEWATRNYASLMGQEDLALAQPSPSEGKRRGFEEEDADFEPMSTEEPSRSERQAGSGSLLADYGGTTAKIDDLLGEEQSFARLVDDEDDFGRASRGLDGSGGALGAGDESYTLEAPAEQSYRLDEGLSEDELRTAGIAPPEDTLFGAAGGMGARQRDVGGDESVFEDKTAFGPRGDRSSRPPPGGFRMMGEVDHTLHGGQLLESEPFDASPLQGRYKADY